MFADVTVGGKVIRMLAGTIPMPMTVTDVKDDRIVCTVMTDDGVPFCDHWEFDKVTGAEIDDFLNWGPPPKMTGSYIVKG
jgi:hypothetical protein